jgi:6-phosphofructo-2-kinase/fructose-2,6-biphosphatase 2
MTEEAPDTPLPAVRTLGQDESGADSPGPFSADYQGFFELKDILALQKRKPRRLSFSEEKSHRKLVLALVGLPARGKSYIAKKILNYALWRGHVVRVFNVGNFRREVFKEDDMAHFFDPDDPEMKRAREKLAEGVLEQALHWLLEESGQIAIFDATNSVKSRRRLVKNKCESAGVRLLFIESVCDDPAVLESNMKTKIAKSPDYLHMEFEAALKDLEMRIQNYAKVYETIDDEEDLSYVKLVNLQSKVICHHIKGYFCRLLVFYLMNLKINRRPIWLVRAGDCQDSTEHDEDHQLSHVHFNDCRLRYLFS